MLTSQDGCDCVIVHQVAEKRKSLLDELAIKYQTEMDRHRGQTKQMEEQHVEEVTKKEERHRQEVEQLKQKLHDIQVTMATGLSR